MTPLTSAALALCIFTACTVSSHKLPVQNDENEFLETAETVNVGYAQAANSLDNSQKSNAPFWWMADNSPFRQASSLHNDNSAQFISRPKAPLDLSNNPFLNGGVKHNSGSKYSGASGIQNTERLDLSNNVFLGSASSSCDVCVSAHLCKNGFVNGNVQGLTKPNFKAPFCGPAQVCCAIEPQAAAIVSGIYDLQKPEAGNKCGPPEFQCVPFEACVAGNIDPDSGISIKPEFKYCARDEVCCLIPENYSTDVRFPSDQLAAGTQNVQLQAVPFGTSDKENGAKPPRQAPSFDSQDEQGYQYTKPTQGYLPAASSVDEATKKPFKADAYIPPADDERHFSGSKISAGSILPPKRPVEEDKQAGGTNNSPTVIRPQQNADPAPVPLPQHGCAAALKCVDINFCTFEGVMSKSVVTLTPRQNEYRVPLTDCLLPESTKDSPQVGKCCRDPDYVDPWPASQLGQYNPDLLGFDNGQYKGERYQSKHRQQVPNTNVQQPSQSLSSGSSQVQHQSKPQQPYQTQTTYQPQQPQKPQQPIQPQQPYRPQPQQPHLPQPQQPQQPQQPHHPQQPQQPQHPHQPSLSPQPSSQRPQSTVYQHQTTQFDHNTFQTSPKPQQPHFQQPNYNIQTHHTGSGSLSSGFQQNKIQQTPFQQNTFQSSPKPQTTQFQQNSYQSTSRPATTLFQQNTYQSTSRPQTTLFQQNTYQSTVRPQVPQFQQNTYQSTLRPQTLQVQQNVYHSTQQIQYQQSTERPFHQNTFQSSPRPHVQPTQRPQVPQFQQTYQTSPKPQFPTTSRPQYNQFQQSTTGQVQSTFKQEFHTSQRQEFDINQRQDYNKYQTTQKTNFQQTNVFESKFPTTARPQLPNFQPEVSYTGNTGQNKPPKSSYDVPEYSATGSRNCGFRNMNASPIGPGPIDGNFGEFPWQAMVLLQTNKSLLCGGAIVEQDAVVTAAHCVNGLNPNDVLIKGGEWKLGVDDEPKTFQIVKVKSISFHPAYQPTDLLYDVAILHLEEKLRFDTHIGSICVPETDQEPEQIVQESKKCVATGWGKETLQVHLKDSIIHKLDIDLLPNTQCESRKSYYFGAGFDRQSGFCARPTDREENICEVDYGSALACERADGKYYLQAVYSWDSGCQSSEQVTSFSKIDAAWLRKTLKNPQIQEKKRYPTPKPQKPQFEPTQSSFQETQKPYQPSQPSYQPTQSTFQQTQKPYQSTQHVFESQKQYQPTQATFPDTQKPYQPTQATFQDTQKPYQPTHATFQETHKPYQPTQSTYQETRKPYQPVQDRFVETNRPYQPTQPTFQDTQKPYQPTHTIFQETQKPYQPTQGTQKPYQPSPTQQVFKPTQPTFQQSPSPFQPSQATSRPQSPFNVTPKPDFSLEVPKFDAPQPQATSDNFLRPQEQENPFKGSGSIGEPFRGPAYLPPLA